MRFGDRTYTRSRLVALRFSIVTIGWFVMQSFAAPLPAGEWSDRIRQMTGIPLAEELLAQSNEAQLAERLLRSIRFLDPAPPRTWLLTKPGTQCSYLNASFTSGGRFRYVLPEGLLFHPLDPTTPPDQGPSHGCRIHEPPKTGLVRLRLIALRSPHVAETVPAPRLAVLVGEKKQIVTIDGTVDDPQVVDSCFFLEDVPRIKDSIRNGEPKISMLNLKFRNELAQPLTELTEEQQAEFRKQSEDREGKTPIPWLLVNGVELEVDYHAEWFGPAVKRALSQDTAGGHRAIDRICDDLFGPDQGNSERNRAHKILDQQQDSKTGVDDALRRALLPVFTAALQTKSGNIE